MKFISLFVITTGLLLLSSGGATVATSGGLQTTVVSTGNPIDSDPDPLVDYRNLVNGIVRGRATSSATNLMLSVPQIGDFSVTGDGFSAELERFSNGGKLPSSATSSYEINFSVAADDGGLLKLDFSYLLQNLGVSSELSWSLIGPDPNISVFEGGSDTASGSAIQAGLVSQSATLSTSGSYTFAISVTTSTSDIPNGGGLKSYAGISGFSLSFTQPSTVPEPSTGALVVISSLLLLRRRRVNPSRSASNRLKSLW